MCRVWRSDGVVKTESTSPFYRHKEGRCTFTGRGRSRRSSPNWGCAVTNYCRKYTVPYWRVTRRAWRSSWASSLVLRRSHRHPGSSSGRRGGSYGEYRSPCTTWRRSEGPAGGGPDLVKVEATSEGRAHAVRGFRGGESTREVRGVGSTVAGAVPSTSRTASQVLTVAPQHPKWRSSDRSWRTGLRSQPLCGVET